MLLLGALSLAACGGGGGGNQGSSIPPPAPDENPGFRAIAGVSMGAYGAMNIGTKESAAFGVIGALGGPVALDLLLRDVVINGLAVRPATSAGGGSGFTFDHMPSYPSRDTRISLFKDLVIAFGNPFLHHPDLGHQYLASDSEPARIRMDDAFGAFQIPQDPRGFLDGNDVNHDGARQVGEAPTAPTDVLLAALGSLQTIAPGSAGVLVGGRNLADLDGDGVYDVGDGLVINASEPFDDANGNGTFDPGESFSDVGLDGVAGTGDFGEGNGTFDVDPDRAHWLAEDPYTRLAGRSADQIAAQRIYMDVGTEDEFGFAAHYASLVTLLQGKGVDVAVEDGFSGDCLSVPKPSDAFLLVRYPGGHIGIPDDDAIRNDLSAGDVCGALIIWQRILTLFGFLDQSFPDGNYGTGKIDIDFTHFDFGNLDLRGDVVERDIPSPALAFSPGADVPTRKVLVYRPVKFFHSNASFPIVYFLGGYGQKPEDFKRVADLLDVLIATRQIQNMYVAFLPGDGGHRGSFYVNHIVPEDQVPSVLGPTSGRYEDSILQDLLPVIEGDIVRGRVRR